ncbi:hypothetical protein EDD80_103297 [Anseongella ginsenosidimutans]|uniref:Uncharacterized protein n=1 Tax=Anseongella ginsenosidimutans TaxID=496056 RepID=A0A4V2UTZ8_9SPHI|nr:hypothetical protein [Anseongella ginsenosidimutans]TCS88432.1 hypothetical protein EDD80_103297 [Anseongella ginsenosidimutans]
MQTQEKKADKKDGATAQPDYWKNKYVFLLENYNKLLLNALSEKMAKKAGV